ncbi:hypothetical protein QYM36_017383 [Artemia franciscana]|uniref:Uncharacterized protein n=1 Tax=Artemia franciscana TaxID=6661 RepID=A0AA88HD75_ARTSF|nr:hypothetical protein QYM36_017383 [Artemia franciscana]
MAVLDILTNQYMTSLDTTYTDSNAKRVSTSTSLLLTTNLRFQTLCSNIKVHNSSFGTRIPVPVSPLISDNVTASQIDYIPVRIRWQSSAQLARAYKGVCTGSIAESDLTLVGAKIPLCLSKRRKVAPKRSLNIGKLDSDQAKHRFRLKLQNRFDTLPTSAQDPKEMWLQFKTTTTEVAPDILGYCCPSRQSWILKDTLETIEETSASSHLENQSKLYGGSALGKALERTVPVIVRKFFVN